MCRTPRCDPEVQRTSVGRLGNHCEVLSVQVDESLDQDADNVWRTQLVSMVKKKNDKLTMRGFRPMRCCRLSTLCSKTFLQLAGGALPSRHGPQDGHVPGRQGKPMKSCGCSDRVAEQATEWQIPVFVMDCDVAAAFDHVTYHGIIEATLAVGVPPVLIAALIRECRNYKTIVKVDDFGTSGIRRTRSVPPQGLAWNELLKAADLQIDWREAVWCSTAKNSLAASITVSEKLITRRAREEGFKALGVRTTFDGHFTRELAEREVAAWRLFCANQQLLCDNNLSLKSRLRLLTSCVVSSMYWCARSWIVTSTQCTHLRAVQDRMLRKMIHVPRRPEDSAESHMTRWARLLRYCRAKYKFPHSDETYFASNFSWCGHIARITTRDSKRKTGKLFLYENMAWLRSLKKEMGTHCHGSRFRVWRWEQAVAQCMVMSGSTWRKTLLYGAPSWKK